MNVGFFVVVVRLPFKNQCQCYLEGSVFHKINAYHREWAVLMLWSEENTVIFQAWIPKENSTSIRWFAQL